MTIRETNLNPLRFSNIKTVFFSNLILGLCNGFYNVLLQPYLVGFVTSEKKLGIILTISSIMQSITLILVAKTSDTRGRRSVYLSSLLLFIFSFVFYTQSYNLLLVITALLIFSFAFGIREPAKQALTAESSEDRKKTASFSLVSLAFYASGLIGPIVIRLLAGKIELRIYFYGLLAGFTVLYIFQLFNLRETLLIENVEWSIYKDFIESLKSIFIILKQFLSSLLHFLSIPLYLIFKRDSKTIENAQEMNRYYRRVENHVKLFRDILDTKGVRYALGYFIFDAFIWGISVSIFNGSVILVYGFTEADIAVMSIVFNISTILFFIPLTLFSEKIEKNEILVLSQIFGSLFITMNIIAFFTLPAFRKYAIWIGWIGLGGSVAFWIPGIMSIMTDFDPTKRAEIYGTVSGLQSLGWIPTSIIAGVIIESISFLIPFLITIILLPLDIFLAWKFPIRKKKNGL